MADGHERRDGRRIGAIVLVAFAILVAVMTYPQVLHLADGTRDWGDPLLNSWIMWWEVHAVRSGNLAGFFDANIFFPHHDTLAFSEFLLPQTLVAAPLLLLFDNPVIAYNVVLLLSFLATAFSMYLLGKQLTGDPFAGFVAGLAMAFSPFMFSHLSHVQIIGAAGIPLAFLFLHRYFDGGSLATLLCFSAAYIGQCLANAYYAVYLTCAAGAYIVYRAVRDRRLRDGRLYRDLAVHTGLSVAALWPFFGRYVTMGRELGFVRSMAFDTNWYNFLGAPPINRLYGAVTAGWRYDELALFPGLTVVALAIVGVLTSRETQGDGTRGSTDAPAEGAASRAARWSYRFLGALIVAEWLLIVAISVSGGFAVTIAGAEVRAYGFRNPFTIIIVALILRALLRRRLPRLQPLLPRLAEPQRFYGWLLFISVILTFGPRSPYRLLFEYLPGFSSMRATPRIHILTVLCLAVFAAYGTHAVVQWLTARRLAWTAAALPLVILAESFSAPLPMHEVQWGEDMPAVYAWLAQQEGDYPVVELPFDEQAEFTRMLYSTVHQKPLVNGASGFQAPVYEELALRDEFPSSPTLRSFRELGVRWVIVHRDQYGNAWDDVAMLLPAHADVLRPVQEIGPALVLETPQRFWRTRATYRPRETRRELTGEALPHSGWSVHASVNDDFARWAIDGDLTTRWHSEPQRPGDELFVDLGAPTRFDSVVLRLGDFPHDYPRGWRVEVSDDGEQWSTAGRQARVRPPITEFLHPRGLWTELELPGTEARYLRIVQTGSDPVHVWSVHEIELRRR
ncbi:MAG: discoidin domain-containing protein [Acidobacteriota bacterium]